MQYSLYHLFREFSQGMADWLLSIRRLRALVLRNFARQNILLCREMDDHVIMFHPHDFIGEAILDTGAYQRDTLASAVERLRLANALRPGGIWLEIGANIGSQTVYAKIAHDFSRYVCFEPDPRTGKLLKMNIALNGMSEKCTVLEFAAGSEVQTAQLFQNPRNFGASSLIPANGPVTRSIEIEVRRVEDILQDNQIEPDEIAMVWMDVEGFELDAFKGMETLLNARAPLVFEFTPKSHHPSEIADFSEVLFKNYDHVFTGERFRDRLDRDRFLTIVSVVDILAYSDGNAAR